MAKVLLEVPDQECDAANRIAKALQELGWPYASRSLVMRHGVSYINETLNGKSHDEILNFFVERVRRAGRVKKPPSAP